MLSKLSTLAIVTCLAFESAVMSLPLANSELYELIERGYTNALDTRMFEMDLEDIDARVYPAVPTSTVSAPLTVNGRGPRQHRNRGQKNRLPKIQNIHHDAQTAAEADPAPASADASSGGPGEAPALAEPAPSADEGPLSARGFLFAGPRLAFKAARKLVHKVTGSMSGRKTGSPSNGHFHTDRQPPTPPNSIYEPDTEY